MNDEPLSDGDLVRLPGRLRRIQHTNRNENIKLLGQELSAWRGSYVRELSQICFSLLATIDQLKEECQLRWNEGESAISECGKLKLDIKCLEESRVDKKAFEQVQKERKELEERLEVKRKNNEELYQYTLKLKEENAKLLETNKLHKQTLEHAKNPSKF